MKGELLDIIPSVEAIITSLIILTVVAGTFAGSATGFTKAAILGIQADRITNSALLVQSEDMTIRSELSGYNISYRPSSSSIVMDYKDRRVRNNVERLEGAYAGINAPRESKKINSYICIKNKNNVLHMTVDRCA